MEDAIALASQLSTISVEDFTNSPAELALALEEYQTERRVEFLKLQSAARNSMQWFEQVDQYTHLPAFQFAYGLLTRSQRLSHENLRQRDAQYIAQVEEKFAAHASLALQAAAVPSLEQLVTASTAIAPMFTPFRLRSVCLKTVSWFHRWHNTLPKMEWWGIII